MRESPRARRLRTDLKALERLRAQSTILDFSSHGRHRGVPESYVVRFHGKGIWRPQGTTDIRLRESHEVTIQLRAGYPRMMPELAWKTPIFHPNISSGGIVCLGGYGTHWAPSLQLDELCTMLWDMLRYRNYDIESPYNREAAHWAKTQDTFGLPLDPRPIRDRLAGRARVDFQDHKPPVTGPGRRVGHSGAGRIDEEDEIIDAEVVEPQDPDILFID